MCAAFHITFLGTQPTFTQVPPKPAGLDHDRFRPVSGRAPGTRQAATSAANHRQIVVVLH